MRKVTVDVLLALAIQASLQDLAATQRSSMRDLSNQAGNKWVNKLFESFFQRMHKLSPSHHASLDTVALGKPGHYGMYAAQNERFAPLSSDHASSSDNKTQLTVQVEQAKSPEEHQLGEVDRLCERESLDRMCRICLEEEVSGTGTFVAPCNCTGSQEWVHFECLQRWYHKTDSSQPEICSVCKTQYSCKFPSQDEFIVNLIATLKDGCQEAQTRAASALREIAANLWSNYLIQERGGIPELLRLLRGSSQEAQEHAAGALAFMAESSHSQYLIRRGGGIQPLVKVLREGSPAAQTQAAGVFRRLARNSENDDAFHAAGGIQALIDTLKTDNKEAQTQAAEVFAAMADRCADDVEASRFSIDYIFGHWHRRQPIRDMICDEGAVQSLVHVLRAGDQEAQADAAFAMTCSLVLCRQRAVTIQEAGGIQVLTERLRIANRDSDISQEIRKNVAAVFAKVSHIAMDNGHLNVTFDHVTIRTLIRSLYESNQDTDLSDDAESAVEHIACAIGNLASHSQYHDLIQTEGGIQALAQVLYDNNGHSAQFAAIALALLQKQGQHELLRSQRVNPLIIRHLIGILCGYKLRGCNAWRQAASGFMILISNSLSGVSFLTKRRRDEEGGGGGRRKRRRMEDRGART
eukprot:gnl/MRDRNA2_/MRDRNA2_76026_c0_seq1.p1 gnl/MRDRNA2_/MRDRNA2_76026_c0~~gnl/MRDRNA2_/MRDRNA2_76026_c0_seq1.p1  ORF type:complete len:636 (-),score=105.25 gnl/MRDRNA2_/MRDRNA2_76026_c0_seq1:139-2046(-)